MKKARFDLKRAFLFPGQMVNEMQCLKTLMFIDSVLIQLSACIARCRKVAMACVLCKLDRHILKSRLLQFGLTGSEPLYHSLIKDY
jgi:hypothetical protein